MLLNVGSTDISVMTLCRHHKCLELFSQDTKSAEVLNQIHCTAVETGILAGCLEN